MNIIKLGVLAIIALITGINAFSKETKSNPKREIEYYVIATIWTSFSYLVTTTQFRTCDDIDIYACAGSSLFVPTDGLIKMGFFNVTQYTSGY